MQKAKWMEPQVNELGLENTEYGNSITPNVDASYTDSKGDNWWSFS